MKIVGDCIMVRSVTELRDYATKVVTYMNDKEALLDEWLRKVYDSSKPYVKYLQGFIEDTIDYLLEVETKEALKSVRDSRHLPVVIADIHFSKEDIDSVMHDFNKNRNNYGVGFPMIRPEDLGYGDFGIERKEYLWHLFKHVLGDIKQKMEHLGYQCELEFDDDVLIIVTAVL